MKNWDCNKNDYVETSKELKRFFKDIEIICKKHGYSISHEDGHGAFEIEKYNDDNIDWLKNANLRLKQGQSLPIDIVVGQSEQLCQHEWIDARNEVVKSGYICLKCNNVKA